MYFEKQLHSLNPHEPAPPYRNVTADEKLAPPKDSGRDGASLARREGAEAGKGREKVKAEAGAGAKGKGKWKGERVGVVVGGGKRGGAGARG